MNPQIFRAYDIRGIADRDLTDEVASAVGKAYGTFIRRMGGKRVALSRDCRLSSERLFRAMSQAILLTGVDVVDVGIGPSPLLYWSVFHLDTDGGLQITGSHNPGDQNGFKMMAGKRTLHGEDIVALKALIERQDFERPAPHDEGQLSHADIGAAYVRDVVSRLSFGERKIKVAIDGGNGTGGPIAMALMKALGAHVDAHGLFIPMDGHFPNHHPDPTVEENLADLRRAVLEDGFDLGIAYDGDGDRIGVLDDRGEVLWGDRLMILLSRALLAKNPGATIVGEVKCSQTLFADIAKHGGRPVMGAVGHSIIKDRMKAEGALLAGEMSGHIFYAERWYGFDDAIYVTARLLEILSHSDKPLSALLADVPRTFVTPELRLDCDDHKKFDVVAQATAHYGARHPVVTIDGARIDFGDGWGLIRASNTQPVIVLRAESESEAALGRIRAELEGFVARHG
ncbi:MAG TPA: phosphomannomutase/phosphoglucomutase [Myxococcota bacterium]|nr:phosphomannomutase/phosphoglucomutase [Myxococcota bacterium]